MLKPSHSNERNLSKRSTNRRFQLCGRQLHQMLTVVCSNRRGKRSTMETEGSIGVIYKNFRDNRLIKTSLQNLANTNFFQMFQMICSHQYTDQILI